MLDQLHKSDMRADLRLADAVTMGAAPLASKEGGRAKRDWVRKLEREAG